MSYYIQLCVARLYVTIVYDIKMGIYREEYDIQKEAITLTGVDHVYRTMKTV